MQILVVSLLRLPPIGRIGRLVWVHGISARCAFLSTAKLIIWLVSVQPIADHAAHAEVVAAESALLIECLGVVGLEIDVLAGDGFAEDADDFGGDASASMTGCGPDVDDIRVADAVRQDPSVADDLVSVEDENIQEAALG